MRNGERSELLGDIYGGVTAAVVALPLALAFGVASGVGPIAGLYGAIAVGFFAAVFGGTPSQVSGPTGPMTVVMATVVAQFADNLPQAFAIVALGGLLQIAFGLMRVGRYVSYTPYSVVSGFMSGVGIIIILIQTLPFVGVDPASGGPMGSVLAWPEAARSINTDALLIALLALGLMIFWPTRFGRYLPAPLAALIAGTLAGLFVFTSAPTIGTVPTGLPELHIPTIDFASLPAIVEPALILALLGSIDSLLTSLVADSITRTRHDSNRELIGQGIGNVAAGLIGALPGAGATMRTVVNVRAGGRTRLSGALHALILLALVLGLGPIAEQIPHAALAGILMKVGWDIIDWSYLKRFRSAPREKLTVMLVTLALTVFVDLITAVAVGLILAGFVTARWMESEELKGITQLALPENEESLSDAERAVLKRNNGQIALLALRGRFSYASARELVQRIGMGISGYKIAIFDFTDAAHIDTSAALSIEAMLESAQEEVKGVFISGLSGPAEQTLTRLGVLQHVPEAHIVPTRMQAIEDAATLLADLESSATARS
jgi:sulfate permease, SulP family